MNTKFKNLRHLTLKSVTNLDNYSKILEPLLNQEVLETLHIESISNLK